MDGQNARGELHPGREQIFGHKTAVGLQAAGQNYSATPPTAISGNESNGHDADQTRATISHQVRRNMQKGTIHPDLHQQLADRRFFVPGSDGSAFHNQQNLPSTHGRGSHYSLAQQNRALFAAQGHQEDPMKPQASYTSAGLLPPHSWEQAPQYSAMRQTGSEWLRRTYPQVPPQFKDHEHMWNSHQQYQKWLHQQGLRPRVLQYSQLGAVQHNVQHDSHHPAQQAPQTAAADSGIAQAQRDQTLPPGVQQSLHGWQQQAHLVPQPQGMRHVSAEFAGGLRDLEAAAKPTSWAQVPRARFGNQSGANGENEVELTDQTLERNAADPETREQREQLRDLQKRWQEPDRAAVGPGASKKSQTQDHKHLQVEESPLSPPLLLGNDAAYGNVSMEAEILDFASTLSPGRDNWNADPEEIRTSIGLACKEDSPGLRPSSRGLDNAFKNSSRMSSSPFVPVESPLIEQSSSSASEEQIQQIKVSAGKGRKKRPVDTDFKPGTRSVKPKKGKKDGPAAKSVPTKAKAKPRTKTNSIQAAKPKLALQKSGKKSAELSTGEQNPPDALSKQKQQKPPARQRLPPPFWRLQSQWDFLSVQSSVLFNLSAAVKQQPNNSKQTRQNQSNENQNQPGSRERSQSFSGTKQSGAASTIPPQEPPSRFKQINRIPVFQCNVNAGNVLAKQATSENAVESSAPERLPLQQARAVNLVVDVKAKNQPQKRSSKARSRAFTKASKSNAKAQTEKGEQKGPRYIFTPFQPWEITARKSRGRKPRRGRRRIKDEEEAVKIYLGHPSTAQQRRKLAGSSHRKALPSIRRLGPIQVGDKRPKKRKRTSDSEEEDSIGSFSSTEAGSGISFASGSETTQTRSPSPSKNDSDEEGSAHAKSREPSISSCSDSDSLSDDADSKQANTDPISPAEQDFLEQHRNSAASQEAEDDSAWKPSSFHGANKRVRTDGTDLLEESQFEGKRSPKKRPRKGGKGSGSRDRGTDSEPSGDCARSRGMQAQDKSAARLAVLDTGYLQERAFSCQAKAQSPAKKGIDGLQDKQRSQPGRFFVAPSSIAGLGLFAAVNLRESEVAVEYVGETIRPSVADVRETQYGSLDIFFFKASKDCIIDATQKGGVARFINHHCRPNCKAESKTLVGNRKRILFKPIRDIKRGEELTYDYCLSDTSSGRCQNKTVRVPCACRSSNCRGFL